MKPTTSGSFGSRRHGSPGLPIWYERRIYAVTNDTERNAVTYVQRVLGLEETGELDDGTKSHIRGLQLLFGLRTTGIIDDATAEAIDRIWPYGA